MPSDAEDFGALEIGEAAGLDEPARLVQELERLAQRAEAHLRAAGADEGANRELRNTRRPRCGDERLELCRRLLVLQRLDQRLGPGECALEAAALVGRDAVREEAGVDPEPRREPLDRLARRAGLAALDLGDVLLREALARELALGEACGHAELAQPLAQAKSAGGGGAGLGEGGVSGHSG